MDNDTLEMLRSSLRHVLEDGSPLPLADRLAELGWDDVLASDSSTALRTLFELKGDTLATSDALGPQLSATFAAATGLNSAETPGVAMPSPFAPSTLDAHGNLTIDALLCSSAQTIAVPVGPQPGLAIVDGADLTIGSLDGFDPSFGLLRVTGVVAAREISWVDDAASVWSRVVAHGRWLVSCELVGIARHVLTAAASYTGQRVQYGKPIGTFQALQHRIATAHALVVGAGHLAAEAGNTADPWTALVAKAMAGQAGEFACTQAQQCYGAIGFTWEHEFHRYLRRTYLLDRLFGDWRSLEHEIGMQLQTSGVVPHIGSL